MIIRDLRTTVHGGNTQRTSASVVWEDNEYPEQSIFFEVERDQGQLSPLDAATDAFLCGCFPYAALFGETRVRIEEAPCPMLSEGLRKAHAWLSRWGGLPAVAPSIEAPPRVVGKSPHASHGATAFLSGGVDSLHLLLRNRQLYQRDDRAYVRRALFIHGVDIGKRRSDPEEERFTLIRNRLDQVGAEAGFQIVSCRTNLRRLPTVPGFWMYRQNGAALAAVGHAAATEPTLLFLAATYNISNAVPFGSHPALDGNYSSQRVTLVHEDALTPRIEKLRELATWPAGVNAIRVCVAEPGPVINCGKCEKCLRTRLELLAAGIEETEVLGPSLTPLELWTDSIRVTVRWQAICYEELLPFLQARGLNELHNVIRRKVETFREWERSGGVEWPPATP